MEAVAPSTGTLSGPASDLSTPAAHDDDIRLFAMTASQVAKPATGLFNMHSPLQDGGSKDGKSAGMRFHDDCPESQSTPGLRSLRSLRSLKAKGKETATAEAEKKRPLQLLDLPVDILKDIVKEVTHTNDLTALARCHSALHSLAIPHIYSRFDIVWPDTSVHSEPRSGVDALTYGLATLVMAEEVFGEAPGQPRARGNRFIQNGHGPASEVAIRRRRGNHYAHFTRKFSLGNGPPEWVQEYLITKEGGKMLGTLVALAVARMRMLETFIWDMPTGILRDVWLALSSLGDWADGKPCRLEKVWVRWHDNRGVDMGNILPPPPPAMNLNQLPHSLLPSSLNIPEAPQFHAAALDRVEHPSFSVLPPLRSLSVLDIDELAYLDEMAVLIAKSLHKLKELRVGIARHAIARDWVTVLEGDDLLQVDPNNPTAGSLTIGEKRLGGVLGILTGFVSDMRKPKGVLPDRLSLHPSQATKVNPLRTPVLPIRNVHMNAEPERDRQSIDLPSSHPIEHTKAEMDAAKSSPELRFSHELVWSSDSSRNRESAMDGDPLIALSRQASPRLESTPFADMFDATIPPENLCDARSTTFDASTQPRLEDKDDVAFQKDEAQHLDNVLQLESLELERVPLSIPVLQRAIDWTRLTSLTILHCQNHEQLWKMLRHSFAPFPKSPSYQSPRRTPNATPRKGKPSVSPQDVDLRYTLKIKKIHTNAVSPALISFVRETLEPNSLEVLFLQEARAYPSSVSIESIFKGAIKRHRNSLRKILIDSSEKDMDGLPTTSSRWRRWLLNRDILSFVCSGKMPALRELGMAIDYRDWVSWR